MANVETGYNEEKINELIDNLKKSYSDVGETITGAWPSVSSVLRENWIGEDEQSYEKAFVKRVDELYLSAAQVVNSVLTQFKSLGDSWYAFQQQNILSGAETVNSSPVDIKSESVEENAEIIKYEEFTIAAGADRGIVAGSDGTIKTSVSSFVDAVKSGTEGIIDGIDASTAFIGAQQSSAIDTYLDGLKNALAAILTAYQDINDAVTALAGSSYTESDSTVAETMGQSTIEEDVNSQLGEMKWGS